MDSFSSLISQVDVAGKATDEEVEKTKKLLSIYGGMLRRAGRGITEMEEECQQRHRKSIVDYIDMAIDFDHAADRKRIAGRLANMGHSMQILGLMDEALILVRSEPGFGEVYFEILSARYYDAYCKSNEDAILATGISSATYYRHIKNAIRCLADNLWHVVIPDLLITEKYLEKDPDTAPDRLWVS
jgi:hypothetical protein